MGVDVVDIDRHPARLVEGRLHRALGAAPVGGRGGGCGCLVLDPAPVSRARARPPRARAVSSRSRTSMAAPSPITKPSRSAANGRDAPAGSAVRVESAPIRAKAVTTSGVSTDSAPPATTTSQLPPSSRSRATATAVAPEAQAVAGARLAARLQGDGDLARRRVGDHHRDEQRGDGLGARGRHPGGVVHEDGDAPDTDAEHHADPAAVPYRRVETGVGDGLPGRDDGQFRRTGPSATPERPPTASSRSMESTGQAKLTGRPASSSQCRAVECPEHSPSQKLCSSAPAGRHQADPRHRDGGAGAGSGALISGLRHAVFLP
ncbi:hypothetical protein SMICM304S_09203 [Streptomyces microflavus]